MKKIIIVSLCAVAAMASVSCARLEVNQEIPGLRVPAVINATAGVSTRATIDGLQTSWEAGDKISVFDATGKAEGFFTADAAGTSVSFSGTKEEGDVLKYAVYPANENATCAAGVFTTTIPGEQDGTINSSLAVAEESEGAFAFLNAASVIKITIPAEETAINFVAFLADNAAAIAGDVTVSMNDLTAVASSEEGAVKYSRVSVYRDGQPLSGDLYLTVIPGEYSGTIVFGKKDGTVRYAATVKVAAKNYAVDRIKNFGTVANLTWIKGAVPGVFSIDNNGRKCLMSQGFIQYDAANDSWRIADTFVTLESHDPQGVIELFRWNNAQTPTGKTDYGASQTEWSEAGDWAKKLDQVGWSIGSVNDYDFIIRQTSKVTDNRETFGLVRQCLSLVKVEDGEAYHNYTILYPDGWAGQIASFIPSQQIPNSISAEELKTLEDKGCAILGHGGNLDKKGVYETAHSLIIWTTTWKKAKVANSYRFSFDGTNWKREIFGKESACGFCARPFFEVN